MIKKLVHVTERQDEFLRQQASLLGVGVSELIRRIIDEHIYSQQETETGSRQDLWKVNRNSKSK